ncbi:CBS domain-containing protein [Pseudonocardia alni]|jgi:CBS domain-containing protein|uniref:CBS domain protein n=1 Tax=Pseudonocardia alni TaxID=33907 RepID=A0AA44ZSD0_PSEA5|nr:CBS domain-containing protein [Pseudonocardia alni]PKB41208.1 CBS domain protein [Pseudonocardia alni]
MSPRAACRLSALGFTQVHDYLPGKVDWLARNLPVEGTGVDTATIGRHLRHDVATAGPEDTVGEVRARIAHTAPGVALVTSTEGILLGRLHRTTLASLDPATAAVEVMEPGPSTLRPHEPAAEVRSRLENKDLSYAIVTDPDGRLLGTVHPADLP